jgi:hypothetical protein
MARPALSADDIRRDCAMTDKKKPAKEEKTVKEQDDYLEEALEETFPASDPISPCRVDKKPTDKK